MLTSPPPQAQQASFRVKPSWTKVAFPYFSQKNLMLSDGRESMKSQLRATSTLFQTMLEHLRSTLLPPPQMQQASFADGTENTPWLRKLHNWSRSLDRFSGTALFRSSQVMLAKGFDFQIPSSGCIHLGTSRQSRLGLDFSMVTRSLFKFSSVGKVDDHAVGVSSVLSPASVGQSKSLEGVSAKTLEMSWRSPSNAFELTPPVLLPASTSVFSRARGAELQLSLRLATGDMPTRLAPAKAPPNTITRHSPALSRFLATMHDGLSVSIAR
mmetsp:Transcript_33443/g.75533  ORF Transcript_33443/g.75533 Transcript_33443/m.75533 type:complete len:269 (+) Transcript_33443:2793-3599(+)